MVENWWHCSIAYNSFNTIINLLFSRFVRKASALVHYVPRTQLIYRITAPQKLQEQPPLLYQAIQAARNYKQKTKNVHELHFAQPMK